MAFSDTDKDCLVACHEYLLRKKKKKNVLDAADQQRLDDIVTGTEAEKIVVAKWYAENVALPAVQAELAQIDAHKTALQTKESDLQAYTA